LGLAILFGKVLEYGVNGIFFAYTIGIFLACSVYTISETGFNYEELFHEALERAKDNKSTTISHISIDSIL